MNARERKSAAGRGGLDFLRGPQTDDESVVDQVVADDEPSTAQEIAGVESTAAEQAPVASAVPAAPEPIVEAVQATVPPAVDTPIVDAPPAQAPVAQTAEVSAPRSKKPNSERPKPRILAARVTEAEGHRFDEVVIDMQYTMRDPRISAHEIIASLIERYVTLEPEKTLPELIETVKTYRERQIGR